MIDSPIQQLVCCMGQPVAGNPSQYMMEQAFAAAGLDWRFLTLEIAPEKLADAICGMRAMGFRGAEIAPPHKVAVVELVDRLSEGAELMGAVNCVSIDEDRLVGENTDGKGFVESLREITDPSGKRIVLFGAGGAARAIGVELALSGAASVTVVNRSRDGGEALAELIQQRLNVPAEFVLWDSEFAVPEESDIVINGTSIGLEAPGARLPIKRDSLRENHIVAEVNLMPIRTRFLQEATDRGCKTIDGLGMFVNQASISFRVWTGADPDKTVMREAVEEFLEV